jgi:thiazole synthase/sulfur carrier protein
MPQAEQQTIAVTLNGATVSTNPNTSLGAFLDAKGIVRQMIAVEYNGEILSRYDYDTTILSDGDTLEIVQMVGGG